MASSSGQIVRSYFSEAALAKGKRLLSQNPLPELRDSHTAASAFASASNDLERSEGQKSSEMVYLALCEAMNFRCPNAHGAPVTIKLASHPARRKFVRFLLQNAPMDEVTRMDGCYLAADELHKNFFTNEMDVDEIDDSSQLVSALIQFFQELTLPAGTKEAFQEFIKRKGKGGGRKIHYDQNEDAFK